MNEQLLKLSILTGVRRDLTLVLICFSLMISEVEQSLPFGKCLFMFLHFLKMFIFEQGGWAEKDRGSEAGSLLTAAPDVFCS